MYVISDEMRILNLNFIFKLSSTDNIDERKIIRNRLLAVKEIKASMQSQILISLLIKYKCMHLYKN